MVYYYCHQNPSGPYGPVLTFTLQEIVESDTTFNLLRSDAPLSSVTSPYVLENKKLISTFYIKSPVHYQVRANETNSEAKRQFSDRNRDVLMNVQSPHKWWSTLKSEVIASSSLLPPLVREGGGLVCESVGKADLL